MPGSIDTNDDRFLTAVWENGDLWTGGNDACLPPNDTAARPCSRLIQVFTSGATVNQDFDIGSTGSGLYFPAFALDSAGDMYVVYNISSSTQYVGVRIVGQLAFAAAFLWPRTERTSLPDRTAEAVLAVAEVEWILLSQCSSAVLPASSPDAGGAFGRRTARVGASRGSQRDDRS
jgi:hypothetical protein